MPDTIVQFFREANIAQLFAIGLMFWFFYTRLNAKMDANEAKTLDRFEKMDARFEKSEAKMAEGFEKSEAKTAERFEKIEAKIAEGFEKLEGKINDVDKRLCRIEGSLATQGHCLFSQNQHEKKAE